MKRHPRESFLLASKLPTFAITAKEQVQQMFEQSLERSGAGYFDYYLLHNLNNILYDGIVREFGMFETLKEWKAAGKIKHIGFSFHDEAETLDRMLREHPEVEFVQICVNYLDWEHWSVQARKCYEVIRKHGRQVVVMETVKDGTLASLPNDVMALLKAKNPERSPVDWSLRFGASLDGVLVALSGMSTLEQVEQNTSSMQNFQPLDTEELSVLSKAAAMMDGRMKYPLTDAEKLKGICPKGIRAAELIRYYNEAIQEINPAFSSELNYYRLLKARSAPVSACDRCGKCAGLFPGGDVPDILREAEAFFEKYGFFL
ncbi:MAG: aldo/keto reductase [Oscillospiraceae bacterium]|nr:aldo/keto reductase [Oscillospiraceae bacterium]